MGRGRTPGGQRALRAARHVAALGLTWRAVGDLRVRVSAGPAIKEPTFFENFATGFARGNPGSGARSAPAPGSGAGRRRCSGTAPPARHLVRPAFRDLIQYTATPSTPDDPNFYNVARSRVRGVETAASVRVGSLHADAAWTWLDPRVVDGGVDEGPGGEFAAGQPLLRRPRHTLDLTVGLDGSRGGVWGSIRVVGSRQDRDFSVYPAERVTLDGYANVELGADVPVRSAADDGVGLTLTLRGENLLDARYQEVLGFPAPGRALYVGGQVSLGGGGRR